MAYPPLAAMRTQIDAQITAWGVLCDVLRFAQTADNTGRKTGAWASLSVSEKMWIQPFTGRFAGGSNIAPAGLNAETTHLCFQTHDGTALVAKDRVDPPGSDFVYDVIESQAHETHRETMLRQVRWV